MNNFVKSNLLLVLSLLLIIIGVYLILLKEPKDDVLPKYGKEWCDYHEYKYIDVIPINGYHINIDSVEGYNQRWVQYYFNPVESSEYFYADDIRYGGFDTTFVVRYKDVDPGGYTDMISILY